MTDVGVSLSALVRAAAREHADAPAVVGGGRLPAAARGPNQEQCRGMPPPPVRPDDRVLLVLPLFHVYGLNAGFGLVAATGACAVLAESFDPAGSLEVMA